MNAGVFYSGWSRRHSNVCVCHRVHGVAELFYLHVARHFGPQFDHSWYDLAVERKSKRRTKCRYCGIFQYKQRKVEFNRPDIIVLSKQEKKA